MSPSLLRRLHVLAERIEAVEACQRAARSSAVLAKRLAALGVDTDKARKAADKAQRCGCGLCMAKTRKGLPCLALGSGTGGRCRFHGGMSTGPKTPDGKRRSLEALARGRAKAAANRRR